MSDHEQARSEPVEDGCVYCKVSQEEADDDVEFHDIDTSEQICSTCLGCCRSWKRTVGFRVLTSTEIPEDISRAASKAALEAGKSVLDDHDLYGKTRPAVTSNAEAGYEEVE